MASQIRTLFPAGIIIGIVATAITIGIWRWGIFTLDQEGSKDDKNSNHDKKRFKRKKRKEDSKRKATLTSNASIIAIKNARGFLQNGKKEKNRDAVDFPQLGIRLNFLLDWARKKEISSNFTTADVCQKIIKPETQIEKCSYCDYLKSVDTFAVGRADVFISHAWQYKFWDLLRALETYFDQDLDVYLWIDIFCFNQHVALELDFHWWSGTFQQAILSFGKTVMVLAPWNDPIPLLRGWCVWELYCTIVGKSQGVCEFDIALSSESETIFIEQMNTNGPPSVIDATLAKIDCKNSQCYKEEDLKGIHAAINCNIGFTKLNKAIFTLLRNWITTKYEEECYVESNRDNNIDNLKKLHNLSSLYIYEGKYNEAYELESRCVEGYKRLLGLQHDTTLTSLQNIAMISFHQGKLQDCKIQFQECLQLRILYFGEDHASTLSILNNLGLLYKELGEYDNAERILKQCLRFKNSENDFNVINNLALVMQEKGKFDEAEILFKKCLNHNDTFTRGEKHSFTLNIKNNLAMLYKTKGDYQESSVLLEEILEIRVTSLGKMNPETLLAMNNLASVYKDLMKYDEAERMYKECRLISKELFGPHHPRTCSVINNLALLHSLQGNYKAAIILYEECIDLQSLILGRSHPNTLISIHGLAVVYKKQNEFLKAEELFKESIDHQTKSLGENHPVTLNSKISLADSYVAQKKLNDAEPLYVNCLDHYRRIYGKDHTKCVEIVLKLAEVYNAKDLKEKSEPLLKEFMESHAPEFKKYKQQKDKETHQDIILQTTILMEKLNESFKINGISHLETLSLMKQLGIALFRQGEILHRPEDYEKARNLLETCLPYTRTLVGANHQDTIIILTMLGNIFVQLEEFDKAERYLSESHEKNCLALGKLHPSTLTSRLNLGILYQKKQSYSQAIPYYKELFHSYLTLVGPNHPMTLFSRDELANLYQLNQNYKEAKELLQESIQRNCLLLGEQHSATIQAKEKLQLIQFALEKEEKEKGNDDEKISK